jgi:ATP-dependent protease ClpP protease subunit
MNKDDRDICDKCIDRGVIPIMDDISCNTVEVITYVIKRLLMKDVVSVHFLLSSSGGDGAAALEVYDMLRIYPFNKEVIVCGRAHSAASVILLAFDKRYATVNSRFLIHHGRRTVKVSDLLDKKKTATLTDEVRLDEARYTEVFKHRTRMTEEQILKLNLEDRHILTSEAISLGIIHEIWDKPMPWRTRDSKQ